MGCTPSFHVAPTGGFCRGGSPAPSPPCSSNHLLSGTSTNQSTPSHPEREKVGCLLDEHFDNKNSIQLTPMRYIRSQIRTLLVFPRDDATTEAWKTSCKKQGHEVLVAGTADDAVKMHLELSFDLLVVDARSPKYLKAEPICSCVRASENAARCVLAAVVKKSALEKDANRINRLLNIGFNRVFPEASSSAAVANDLLQLERCDLLLLHQQKMQTALVAALDLCKDLVHVTDTQHRIQHINRACENQLGYTIDDLFGKTIWEVHGSDHHRQDLRTPTDVRSLDVRSVDVRSLDVRSLDSHHSSIYQRPSSADNRSTELREIKENKVSLDVSEAVNLQMRRGKEWEGLFSCRRKSGDLVHLPSKVTPVALQPRRNEYYVYWSDGHHGDKDRVETFPHHTRGSVKSHRKNSYDIRSLNSDGERRSSIIRRQSVAKLHSFMMEAPITRVVSIITAAQDSCPAYIAQALEKVLEILRSTELYNPQIIHDNHNKPVQSADPVATDLLGALLSHSPKPLSSSSTRRSSNDQGSIRDRSQSSRPSLPTFQQASSAIREILADDMQWTFDVIKLERLTDLKPLVWLGMSLMCQMNVPSTLDCDEQTLQNWLTLIEANYQTSNSYHNSTHAADVLQTTAFFLDNAPLKKLIDPLDVAASLIAAVVHDVDHPGKNSQFLCNTNNELAILYNDIAVLESHHAAVSFKLTASDDRVNILKGLDQESYKYVRKTVVDMVLATDMSKHFEHVNKFINMLDKCVLKTDEEIPPPPGDREMQEPILDLSLINTAENLEIVKRMMIKCADINNPLRPLYLCKDWAHRIANEYFNQTEEEKRRHIPVVMPQFDRTTCSIPKSQIGFIDFFIFDMFEAWNELSKIPDLMNHLNENYQYWKSMDELERARRSSSSEMRSPSIPEPPSTIPEIPSTGNLEESLFDQDIIVEEIS